MRMHPMRSLGSLQPWVTGHFRCVSSVFSFPFPSLPTLTVHLSSLCSYSTGRFFKKEPMKHFGVTPLAYAACFGHHEAFKALFVDEHDGGKGAHTSARECFKLFADEPKMHAYLHMQRLLLTGMPGTKYYS